MYDNMFHVTFTPKLRQEHSEGTNIAKKFIYRYHKEFILYVVWLLITVKTFGYHLMILFLKRWPSSIPSH